MAVDEALLENASQGTQSATLRLYAWEPACLSLGYAQSAGDANLDAIQHHGWMMVRRPTGGRAILHTDELTYSIVASHHEPRLGGSIMESYRRIAVALLTALHLVGIPAQASELHHIPPGADPKGPVCFEVPSNYEITWENKKLIGSAQARRKEGILQHGSLPLGGDLTRITEALAFENPLARQAAAQRLLTRAVTAADSLGHPLTWDAAAQAFIQAFSNVLNLELRPGTLSEVELECAQSLLEKKYRAEAWTFRV
jgi:lipoate-protein ligase A